MKRATIYLEDDLHRALKLKALEAEVTISELVNSAVKTSLHEDHEDLNEFENRESETTMSYHELLKELKDRGQI
jgi:hypothetical protein